MKIFTFLLVIVQAGFSYWLNAQNLVMNPSFEVSYCPTGASAQLLNLTNCPAWQGSNTASSDYFNVCHTLAGDGDPCSGIDGVGVPLNILGWQQPLSGDGYAGCVYVKEHSPAGGGNYAAWREYAQGILTQTLTQGVTYRVDFHISLAETSTMYLKRMAVHLGPDQPFALPESTSGALTVVSPSFTVTGDFSDAMNWMHLSGNYTAQGDEEIIIIGNFDAVFTQNTHFVQRTATNPGNCGLMTNDYNAYYYLDDVNVSACQTCESVQPFLKPETEYSSTSCCYELFIESDEDACNVYGVRLRSDDWFMASHQDFDWPAIQTDPGAVAWFSANEPLVNDDAKFVANVCFAPSPEPRVIYVDYLDENGNTVCTEEMTISCCKNCSEEFYQVELEGVEYDETGCCMAVNLSSDWESACKVGIIEVIDPMEGPVWINLPIPLIPGGTLDNVYVICNEYPNNPRNIIIRFRDANGFFICEKEIEVNCEDCCNWTELTHLISPPSFPPQPNCQGTIRAWFDPDDPCDIVTVFPEGPINLMTVVDPYTMDVGYQLPSGSIAIIKFHFVDINGDTVCTKEYEVNCGLIIGPAPPQDSLGSDGPLSSEVLRGPGLWCVPNPATDRVQLHFDLPMQGQVSIKMYNLAGELVLDLADGLKPEGTHQLEFNGNELPLGMYLIQMHYKGSLYQTKLLIRQ